MFLTDVIVQVFGAHALGQWGQVVHKVKVRKLNAKS